MGSTFNSAWTCAAGPSNSRSMASPQSKDPLHGVTLEKLMHALVNHYGWKTLGQTIDIRCFNYDPSIKSSLQFLRKTPWARAKVEQLYKDLIADLSSESSGPAKP